MKSANSKGKTAMGQRKASAGSDLTTTRQTGIILPQDAALTRTDWYIIGLLFSLALCLRLWHLGMPSLFLDESASVLRSMRPLRAIITPDPTDNWPPLHYVLLHWTLGVLGNSDWAVRLPSAVLGAASICFQYLLGRHIFGRRGGIISGLIMAVSIYHIQYSRDAHAYGIYGFVGMISLFCFTVRIFTPRRGWLLWTGYVVGTAAMVLTHVFGVVAIAQEVMVGGFVFIGLLIAKSAKDAWRLALWLGGGLLCVGIIALPYASFLINVSQGSVGLGRSILTLDWEFLVHFLSFQGFGNGVGAVLFGGLVVIGIGYSFMKRRKWACFLLFWLAFPYAVFALFHTEIFFHVRRVMYSLPALLLFCAFGVEALMAGAHRIIQRKWSGALVAAPVLAVWAFVMMPAYRDFYSMTGHDLPRREAAEWMQNNLPAGNIIVFESYYELSWLGPGYYRVPGMTFAYMAVCNRGEDYMSLHMVDRFGMFFEKYPEAAFTYFGCCTIPDGWFKKLFKQRKVFLNAGGLGLSRRGLFHHFIEGTAGHQDLRRVMFELYYNTDDDLIAMARQKGISVFRRLGEGFDFTLTRDLRNWLVITKEASLAVYQLNAGPTDVRLTVGMVGLGVDQVDVVNAGGTILGTWKATDSQLTQYSTVIPSVAPGRTDILLKIRGKQRKGVQSAVLIENIVAEPYTHAANDSPK